MTKSISIRVATLDVLERRVLLSGGLDRSFGGNGAIALSFDPAFRLADVAAQSDGKVLLAGTRVDSATSAHQVKVIRLKADGTLDATFGSGGATTFQFWAGETSVDVHDIAVASNGSILIAGDYKGATNDLNAAVARLTANGSLDNTFDSNGVLTYATSADDTFDVVKPQSNGGLFVGGNSGSDFLIANITSNGKFDSSFNFTGVRDLDLGGADVLSDVVPLSGGKIIAVGQTTGASGESYAAVRLTSTGQVDPTYGSGGKETLPGFSPVAAFLQSDGTILVGGVDTTIASPAGPELVHFKTNGSVDPINGKSSVTIPFPPNFATFVHLDDVAQQPDGKILFAGSDKSGANIDLFIARTDTSGNPDIDFGNHGVTGIDHGGSEVARGLAVAPDAGIFVGTVSPPITNDEILKLYGTNSTDNGNPVAKLASNGTLTATGTAGNDVIFFGVSTSKSDILITVNGVTSAFSAGKVKRLVIDGAAGNDIINYRDFVTSIGKPTLLEGGPGNDGIYGSPAGESLDGGTGDDTLHGYGGNDTLIGSAGADQLYGDAGNDTADYSAYTANLKLSLDNIANDGPTGSADANIHADIENIIGGSGNDLIIANPFANKLIGNAGNDTLWGGDGNDTLDGGSGHDQLYGQGGNDTLLGKDGSIDTLDGGAGFDTAQRDHSSSIKDQVLNIESFV